MKLKDWIPMYNLSHNNNAIDLLQCNQDLIKQCQCNFNYPTIQMP